MIDKEQEALAKLITGFVQGTLTPEEHMALQERAAKDQFVRRLLDEYGDPNTVSQRLAELEAIDIDADWERIVHKSKARTKSKRPMKWWGIAAAAILLIASAGIGWWKLSSYVDTRVVPDHYYGHRNDVLPGNNKAILTLPDGRKVPLGEGTSIQLREEMKSLVNITEDALSYLMRNDKAASDDCHVITVPMGGTYHVVLADGTKVWLNADSRMEYPIAFGASERRIRVSGEVYLEVAKDSQRPFILSVDNIQVEALGTAFNINTHKKHGQVKTILTEGKIRVSSSTQEEVITPGHAVVSSGGGLRVEQADVEEALAWKDGYFYFDKKNMQEILGEIARWYDIEVENKVDLGSKRYMGGIKRSNTLGAVCATLTDLSGKHFAIDGRKLIVN